MAMKTDSSVIRQMEADIQRTETRIEDAMRVIQNIHRQTNNWNDEVGGEFQRVLNSIARSLEDPRDTLIDSQPRLEKLASIVDRYAEMRFH